MLEETGVQFDLIHYQKAGYTAQIFEVYDMINYCSCKKGASCFHILVLNGVGRHVRSEIPMTWSIHNSISPRELLEIVLSNSPERCTHPILKCQQLAHPTWHQQTVHQTCWSGCRDGTSSAASHADAISASLSMFLTTRTIHGRDVRVVPAEVMMPCWWVWNPWEAKDRLPGTWNLCWIY